MADRPQDIMELEKIESQAVEEASREFDVFITALLSVLAQSGTRADKLKKIQAEVKKMQEFSRSFSINQVSSAYSQQAEAILKMIGAESVLTDAQKKELASLVNQMKFDLDNRISYYENLAKRITLRQERAALRQAELGFQDGSEYYTIKGNDFSKDFELRDSKGRPLTTNTIMAVLVGDAIWNSGMGARISTMLLNDVEFGIHRSIIDDRTSDICLTLDGRKRNLRTDELPPLHRHCRSWIEPVF